MKRTNETMLTVAVLLLAVAALIGFLLWSE